MSFKSAKEVLLEDHVKCLKNDLREAELKLLHVRLDRLLTMPKEQWLKRIF